MSSLFQIRNLGYVRKIISVFKSILHILSKNFMEQGCWDMCRQNTIVFLNVAGFKCPILCMLFPEMNCLFKTTAETKINMWGFYKISGWTSDFRPHDWKSESWAFTPTNPVVLEDGGLHAVLFRWWVIATKSPTETHGPSISASVSLGHFSFTKL